MRPYEWWLRRMVRLRPVIRAKCDGRRAVTQQDHVRHRNDTTTHRKISALTHTASPICDASASRC